MKQETENLAWTIYWKENRLQSCVASDGDTDQQALNTIWVEFAQSLDAKARVLDLATGNGAVPAALLTAAKGLNIDAVDQASIDPAQYVKGHTELNLVNFHADTDINALEFSANSFDALTSQFGIEYADLFKATSNVLGLLKPKGRISLIIHHAESAIIKSSQVKLSEMNELLKDKGVIETLMAVLRGKLPFSDLELEGKSYLATQMSKTQAISGQVFTAIGEIADAMQTDMVRAVNLGATLKLRLSSEYERLCQMNSVAKSEAEMMEFKKLLDSNAIELSEWKVVYADEAEQEYRLAWLVQGQKKSV